MAKLNSDFPLLAGDDDPNRLAVYSAVYSELARLGLQVPGRPYYEITRAQLVQHLQQQGGQLVKQELLKPLYDLKSDEEQTDLIDFSHTENGSPTPVNLVFIDLPFAPNVLTTDDVKGAKANNGAALLSAKG